MANAQNSIAADPKKFWLFIHSRKGNTNIPNLIEKSNRKIFPIPYSVINAFQHFFESDIFRILIIVSA